MWKLAAALGLAFCFAGMALGQQGPKDKDGFYIIDPANTDKTVPTSRFEKPSGSLIDQEKASRETLASKEVNRSLNQFFAEYRKPIVIVTWATAILATLVLAMKIAWSGIPLVSAIATVLDGGFFRWPVTPLEWIHKLAIYIGLAEFALWIIK